MVRGAPANTTHTQTEAMVCRTVNYHLRGSRERSGTQRRTKVNVGRVMVQALELLWLAKGQD